MKANPSKKKDRDVFFSLSVFRLLFLIIFIPLSIPLSGCVIAACLWHFLLCRISGITFAGGFMESFTFACALGAFAVCANLLISIVSDAVKKKNKLAEPTTAASRKFQFKTWSDVYHALPGLLKMTQNFLINCAALALFSSLQPSCLHFETAALLLLAAGVLTAGWMLGLTLLCIVVFVASRFVDKKNSSLKISL